MAPLLLVETGEDGIEEEFELEDLAGKVRIFFTFQRQLFFCLTCLFCNIQTRYKLAKARLQSPVVSEKTWVCAWVFNRADSKTWLQSVLLSALLWTDRI